jgi:hypothetical protein
MPTLSVFRTNEISKALWLLVGVMPVSMSMCIVGIVAVGILSRTNIIHLQHIPTLRAPFNWAITGHLFESISVLILTSWEEIRGSTYREPNSDMGISGVAGTTSILLFASRLDDNRVLQCA